MQPDENNELDLIAVGKRIKQLRIAKGYDNLEAFLQQHDISPQQWIKYEQGYNMYYTELYRVCEALGISMKEFFKKGWDKGV